MSGDPLPPLPPGSDRVATWAAGRRAAFQARPLIHWFQAWEPFDTMTSPETYFMSASWSQPPSATTIAEPWFAPVDAEPLDRTILGFVTHPGLTRRAAVRAGEHFNSRVTYLESPPPPTVKVGDPAWDEQMLTLAASPSEAAAALPPRARTMLLEWRFAGHLEVRPGGVVLHLAGLRPLPEHLDRMLHCLRALVAALLGG